LGATPSRPRPAPPSRRPTAWQPARRRNPPLRGLCVIIASTLMLSAAAVSCRDNAKTACGPVQREPLDARSTQHLFPDTPDPTFLTEPPTSGPHRPGLHPTGVLQKPIDR